MNARPGGIIALAGMALAGSWLATPTPARAQAETLEVVERLTVHGRTEEARSALGAWWEAQRPGATRDQMQRALWLRGRLTVDPAQAMLDFQRLVIEYPGGPFSDVALFRLAQATHALGDGEAARRHVAALARDYPGSRARRDAEAWLESAGSPPPPPVRAAPPPGTSAAGGAARPVAAGTPTAGVAASTGQYAVQLGAFASEERARALFDRADEAELDVRLVRVSGSRLLHVRVGRFDDSAGASVFLRRVSDLGFTAAVVRDAHNEERIRQ